MYGFLRKKEDNVYDGNFLEWKLGLNENLKKNIFNDLMFANLQKMRILLVIKYLILM